MAKREKPTVNGDLVTFSMDIKRDNFAERSFSINVTVDFTGVTRAKSMQWNCEGSSIRVKLQTSLRKLSEERLAEMERDGLKVHADHVDDLKTPLEKAREDVEKMSEEQLEIYMEVARARQKELAGN